MFVDFSKVYVAVTHQAKPFLNPSTGSPFFLMVFLVTFRPPLIGDVPTAQPSDVILETKIFAS